jgi:hypothetical protein
MAHGKEFHPDSSAVFQRDQRWNCKEEGDGSMFAGQRAIGIIIMCILTQNRKIIHAHFATDFLGRFP